MYLTSHSSVKLTNLNAACAPPFCLGLEGKLTMSELLWHLESDMVYCWYDFDMCVGAYVLFRLSI